MDRPYLVVRCSRCGEVRVTRASRRFRCFLCGGSPAVSPENIVARATSASEAMRLASMIKAERRRRE